MDVVSVELSVENASFVIGEEVIVAIVVRVSLDMAEALESGAGMRRLVEVINCGCRGD
jgi:hypothetical protein